jgi:hypothetical protein
MRKTSAERFWEGVDKNGPNGCWIRGGHRNHHGYSMGSMDGKQQAAHRISYKLCVGSIPEGMQIDHLCRNRVCVNPDHLEAVTPRQNQLRSPLTVSGQNARKTHCPKGHPLSGKNLYVTPKGIRHCRWCNRLRNRARYGYGLDRPEEYNDG